LTKTFFVNPAAVRRTTKFVKHLAFSYSELTELVVMIEHKYNVTFADNDVERLRSVGDLEHLLSYAQNHQ
jgi:acyl carrier protein